METITLTKAEARLVTLAWVLAGSLVFGRAMAGANAAKILMTELDKESKENSASETLSQKLKPFANELIAEVVE